MLSARAPRATAMSRKALQAWSLIWRAPTLAPLASLSTFPTGVPGISGHYFRDFIQICVTDDTPPTLASRRAEFIASCWAFLAFATRSRRIIFMFARTCRPTRSQCAPSRSSVPPSLRASCVPRTVVDAGPPRQPAQRAAFAHPRQALFIPRALRHRRWHHVSPPARLCDPAAARVAPSASGPRHTRWGIER